MDLDDVMGGLFGSNGGFDQTDLGRAAAAARKDAKRPGPKAPVPLPQIRGKRIDDVLYVRAEDVADALEQLAPTTTQKLITKLRGKQA
jgi:hypothetical protein